MDTLLIIDGNNLLFQMFYGMPSRILNKSGMPIHGTIGFVSVLLKLKKEFQASKVAVVFDAEGSEERKELLPEYKGNRPDNWDELPPEECPFTEEETIVRCVRYLGLEPIYPRGMEADDAIATLAKRYSQTHRVVISSFDSDFFQLIDKNTSVIRYRGKASVLYDEAFFREKFGFSPSSYPLYKAMVGDTADNIPGVKGIGKKRGGDIISRLEKEGTWEGSRYASLLEEEKETVKRNLALIRLEEKEAFTLPEEALVPDEEHFALSNSEVLSACDVFS